MSVNLQSFDNEPPENTIFLEVKLEDKDYEQFMRDYHFLTKSFKLPQNAFDIVRENQDDRSIAKIIFINYMYDREASKKFISGKLAVSNLKDYDYDLYDKYDDKFGI